MNSNAAAPNPIGFGAVAVGGQLAAREAVLMTWGRCGWSVGLQAFSYGFAHGLMTSLVAQFGGAQSVAPAACGVVGHDRAQVQLLLVAVAAGGFREHDRASVRVTAHAYLLVGGGRVWWVPKVKSRASGGLNGEGPLRSDSQGGGPQRFGFVSSFRTGSRGAV